MHFLGKQFICDFIIKQSLWKHLLCGMPLSWKPLKLLLKMLSGTFKRTCTTDRAAPKQSSIPLNKLPLNLKVSLQDPDSNGKRDAIVAFKDSQAVMDIFSQIPKASCTYAVEINPSVKSVCIVSSFLQFVV